MTIRKYIIFVRQPKKELSIKTGFKIIKLIRKDTKAKGIINIQFKKRSEVKR